MVCGECGECEKSLLVDSTDCHAAMVILISITIKKTHPPPLSRGELGVL
jgi:hypothetical protein